MAGYALLAPLLIATATAAARPNIVLILADDLGYGDPKCCNPEKGKIPTPSIDRLAIEGTRFTDCHSPSSVCSPTRYGLLTGRYAWRTRLQKHVLRPYDPPLIDRDRLTLPSLLRKHGYTTACIGKWHLGWEWPRRDGQVVFDQPIAEGPTTRGFDYYFGTDVPNYPPYCFIENDRTAGQPTAMREKRDLDGPPGPELPGWRRDAILPTLARKAAEYIARRAADRKPFFLCFPLTTPHEPIAPSQRFRGKSGISPVADLIMETDWAVGQVLDALDRHGLADHTLVIFTADNGRSTYTDLDPKTLAREGNTKGHYPCWPWRGFKSDAWEGGHRVPMIVRWPGAVKRGTTCDDLVCLTDWMATTTELLGDQLPDNAGEDSISFLPTLLRQEPGRRQAVVLHSAQGRFVMRSGKWKLIVCPGSGGWAAPPSDEQAAEMGLPPMQLYDLGADPAETRNLLADHRDIEAQLIDALQRSIRQGRTTPGKPQENDARVEWRYSPRPNQKGGTKPG